MSPRLRPQLGIASPSRQWAHILSAWWVTSENRPLKQSPPPVPGPPKPIHRKSGVKPEGSDPLRPAAGVRQGAGCRPDDDVARAAAGRDRARNELPGVAWEYTARRPRIPPASAMLVAVRTVPERVRAYTFPSAGAHVDGGVRGTRRHHRRRARPRRQGHGPAGVGLTVVVDEPHLAAGARRTASPRARRSSRTAAPIGPTSASLRSSAAITGIGRLSSATLNSGDGPNTPPVLACTAKTIAAVGRTRRGRRPSTPPDDRRRSWSIAVSSGPAGWGTAPRSASPAAATSAAASTRIIESGSVEERDAHVRVRADVRIRFGLVVSDSIGLLSDNTDRAARRGCTGELGSPRSASASASITEIASRNGLVLKPQPVVGARAVARCHELVRDHALVDVPDEDPAAREQRVVLERSGRLGPSTTCVPSSWSSCTASPAARGSGSRGSGTRRSTAAPSACRGAARWSGASACRRSRPRRTAGCRW